MKQTRKNKEFFILKKISKDYFVILISSILCNVVLFFVRPFYHIAHDSHTYQITSLSQLFGAHRMPVYQLFNYFFYFICGNNYDISNYLVVVAQIVISIISTVLLYDILCRILNNKRVAFLLGMSSAAMIALYGYNELIMTESLAVSFMIFMLWLLTYAVKKGEEKYFIGLSVMAVISTLMRPSFVIMFPLLSLFYILYGIFNNKKMMIKCGAILILGIVVILSYCAHNKKEMGAFCLSDVSYANGMGIIVDADIYDNPQYPEISSFIKKKFVVEGVENKFSYASITAEQFGYDKTIEYMNSCKKLGFGKLMMFYIKVSIIPNLDANIFRVESINNPILLFLYKEVGMLLLPFTYGFICVSSLAFIVDAVFRCFKEKRVLYLELGVSACIWCILILSIMTLYRGALMRITVHMIPCVYVFIGMLFERFCYLIVERKEDYKS